MPTFSGNANYRMDATPSRSGNTISVSLSVTKTWGSGYYTSSPQSWSIWIDGTNYTGTWTYDFQGATPKTIGITTQAKGGMPPGVKGWSASVNMAGGIGTAYAEGTLEIPPNAPAAPTIQAPVRTNDNSNTVYWYDNASASAPYTGLQVQRQAHEGNWGAWTGLANGPNGSIAGNRSYGDFSTVANRVYQYRILASNGSGDAYSATSLMVFTTPGAPSSLTAIKEASGSITLNLTQSVLHTEYKTTLEYSTDGGTTWTALTTLNRSVLTYSHASPPTGAGIKYRARVLIDATGHVGNGLTSAWTESATVPLQSPPNPPSNLTPNGVAFTAVNAQTFTWKHNTVDSSAQTAYEIQYREVGVTAWTTTGKITSTAQSRLFAANTFLNGKQYEWQVRTYGAHATASGWSSTAVFTASALPTATVTVPGATLGSALLTTTWTYFDTEGTAQSAWEATLLQNAVVLESLAGSGTATSAAFKTRLTDATAYSVQVRVRDGSGLWSAWSTKAFSTSFPMPSTPLVATAWDDIQGAVQLTMNNAARTNLARDPIPRALTDWYASGGTKVLSTFSDGVTPAFQATQTSNTTTYIFSTGAQGTFTPGEPITLSALVEFPDLVPGETYVVRAHSQTGNVYYTSGQVTITPVAGVQRISVTTIVPAGGFPANDLNLSIVGAIRPIGYRMRMGQVLIERTAEVRPFTFGNATPVFNQVYRSTNNVDWTLVLDKAPLNTTISDPEAPLGTEVFYRVVAWSDLPSSAAPSVVSIVVPGMAGYWSAGPAFGVVIPMWYGYKNPPAIDLDSGLAEKTLHYFAGRTYPVEFAGSAVERTGAVSFLIMSEEAKRQVERLSLLPAPHLFRLPDGLFMYASIGPVQLRRVDRGAYTVELKVQEVAK